MPWLERRLGLAIAVQVVVAIVALLNSVFGLFLLDLMRLHLFLGRALSAQKGWTRHAYKIIPLLILMPIAHCLRNTAYKNMTTIEYARVLRQRHRDRTATPAEPAATSPLFIDCTRRRCCKAARVSPAVPSATPNTHATLAGESAAPAPTTIVISGPSSLPSPTSPTRLLP